MTHPADHPQQIRQAEDAITIARYLTFDELRPAVEGVRTVRAMGYTLDRPEHLRQKIDMAERALDRARHEIRCIEAQRLGWDEGACTHHPV